MTSIRGLRWRRQGKTCMHAAWALPPPSICRVKAHVRIHTNSFPQTNTEHNISPARRKRGERSSGGNRIHSGPRHYHKDGNDTDDNGRRWISKGLRFQTLHVSYRGALITLTTPHHAQELRQPASGADVNLRRAKGRLETVWASRTVERTRCVTHERSQAEVGGRRMA